MQVLERLPGNPVGIEYKVLDNAFAFSAQNSHSPSFNRVVGLNDRQASHVPELVEWYASRNIVGRFEIVPGIPCNDVMKALTKQHYAHAEYHTILYGTPCSDTASSPGVTVEVVDHSTLEIFLDCYSTGWQVANPEGFKNNVRGWLGQPGWTIYLARYDGKPAGAAILFIDGKTAYCADSAVDPAMRGHGVHQALLRRRSSDAAAQGVNLLCSMAAYLSTSHRNMIRAGFSTLSTKAIWMLAP
jgi:GNAT superfamily N-acetyltransferase